MRLFSYGLGVSFLALCLSACAPQYKDKDMALLMKPELISIVAEPPMATPESQVALAFLLADQHGPLPGQLNLWLPISSGVNGALPSNIDQDALLQDAADLGLSETDLISPVIHLTLKSGRDYVFSPQGLSAQTMTLLAATSDLGYPPEQIAGDPTLLLKEVEAQRVKVGLRTVQVSLYPEGNANPRVEAIEATLADTTKKALTFSTSQLATENDGGAAFGLSRQANADAPLEVKGGTKVSFAVTATDDGPSANLRYQWISNGGDFGGYRLKKEPWRAPKYKDPATFTTEEKDLRGQTAVDWRKDPNLYAVWLILRDNGTTLDSLGQSFAEFFVRIVP